MSRARKILLSLVVLAMAGAASVAGSYMAFTATTTNAGNTITSGTVTIGDDDSGSAMYSVSNQKPGDSVQKCIKLTYSGSLNADVKIYTTDTIGSLGQYLDLTITPGTGGTTFPGCTGFTADTGGDLFTGTLDSFATAHNSWANGLVDNPGTTATKWVTNDAVVYRFTLTLQAGAPDAAQGLTSGSHAMTWEARNQ